MKLGRTGESQGTRGQWEIKAGELGCRQKLGDSGGLEEWEKVVELRWKCGGSWGWERARAEARNRGSGRER